MRSIRGSSIILSLLVAVEFLAGAGCPGGPVTECTGAASFSCPDNTCAISIDACASEPGCPVGFPARCDEHYCSVDYTACPAYGTVPARIDPVVEAPAPDFSAAAAK